MKKHLTAALTALTMTASMLSAFPVQTTAAEEYLVRDKWGYCTTANYAESEHFVIFYGNNDTTGQVNDAFLKRNLENYEKLWHCYGEYLGMENMNVDIYGKSTQKYKTNVYLTYTGLDQYAEGWAFMSAEDGYGIEIISPNAMLDDLTIAHEFGHVVTMQQKAWVDQDITGAWWEPLANWFRVNLKPGKPNWVLRRLPGIFPISLRRPSRIWTRAESSGSARKFMPATFWWAR